MLNSILEQKNFRLRGKSFFLTYPQCPIEPREILTYLSNLLNAKYKSQVNEYIVAREKHADDNLHLHVYLHLAHPLDNSIPCRFLDYEDYHCNIQTTRSCKAVIKYCTKGEDYITNIQSKIDRYAESGEKEREQIAKELMGGKPLHELVELKPKLLFGYARLKVDIQSFLLDKAKVEDLQNPCGVWIAGPPGAGKTTIALTRFGTYYRKGKNKWFDGYTGQEAIVLDDVDKSWAEVCHYLKWWADKWKFLAEVKGSTLIIRPKKCIVTSNYTLEECLTSWSIPQEEWGPYVRRFRSYWITNIDDWEQQL